jgi:tetratricopeptide (TPR) repeat protein
MKKFSVFIVFALLVTVLGCAAAWSQQVGSIVKGSVKEDGKVLVGVKVTLANPETGRSYTSKTDKNGEFYFAGIVSAGYTITVTNDKGETIFSDRTAVGGGVSTAENFMTIEIGKSLSGGAAASATPDASKDAKAPKMTKEQIKAEQEKVANLNTLIGQAQAAMQAQKWPDAEAALKQVIAAQPDTTKWELYKALADSQRYGGSPESSIPTYEKGIQVAQSIVDGKAPKDLRNPNPDPARAKAGIGMMMTSEGNAYVKMGKMDDAIVAFKKAAAVDPNPALAYYNLCALEFNAGKYEDAAAACDKSTAADANKADAWFFKGAALTKAEKPGAADALNKYLQMDANGAHAAEAKNFLIKAK